MTFVSAHDELLTLLDGDDLLTLSEVADRLGIPVTRVSDLLEDYKLAATTSDGRRVVPAAVLGPKNEISKYVAGAITVLIDGGYDDEEILTYFFTPDDSLPGRPIDILHGPRAREVIRRAQAMAF